MNLDKPENKIGEEKEVIEEIELLDEAKEGDKFIYKDGKYQKIV